MGIEGEDDGTQGTGFEGIKKIRRTHGWREGKNEGIQDTVEEGDNEGTQDTGREEGMRVHKILAHCTSRQGQG